MHAATERFPSAEEVTNERFASKHDVMIVHNRLKCNGQWKTKQGSCTEMAAFAEESAADDRYDRMWFEVVPDSVATIPDELGGGIIDFADTRCEECGARPGDCAPWCSLARVGR